MIKNIIFDLGNVLLNFKPVSYVDSKISDKEKSGQIYEEIFKSKEWLMLDKGVVTEDEVINVLCKRHIEDSESIRLVMDNWYQLLTPIHGTVEILKELNHKGYKNYVLSNFQLLAYQNVTKKFDFFNYFDGGIISYKEKLMKPEKDIFNKLIEKYKINPKESLFIDDSIDNVEEARLIGFKSTQFKGPEDLNEKLTKYGVL